MLLHYSPVEREAFRVRPEYPDKPVLLFLFHRHVLTAEPGEGPGLSRR